MTKIFIIVSIALLLGALVVVFTSRALPTEVEQEIHLLNYEHEGRFDYLVYLGPSYLFGPEPEEPLPPQNLKYPTEIIDNIRMSFTYEPALETDQDVEVKAVLENPDIWQKEITLVPQRTERGEFTVYFPLDIDEINRLFDTIDEETQIPSSSRNVTIIVNVISGEDTFSQSLPITLEENLIEVGGNLTQTQSGSFGKFDYSIDLKENSLFDTPTLKPPLVTPSLPSSPTTLKPGQVVFTKLVDKMDVTFYYQFRSDKPVNNVTMDVILTAFLRATGPDNAELWSKKFPLLSTRKSGNFNVSFPLDLVSYLGLFEIISKETEASAESNSVTITAEIHTVAETPFGIIDETFTQVINGSIKGNVLEWDEELTKTQPGSITTSQIFPNKYLGLSVDLARNLSIALTGVFFLFLLFSVGWYVKSKPSWFPQIEKEARQVRKKYGKQMVEATDQTMMEGERTISLDSMEDLISVADELGKPVIHQPPSIYKERHAYYVFDGATRYQYVISTFPEEE